MFTIFSNKVRFRIRKLRFLCVFFYLLIVSHRNVLSISSSRDLWYVNVSIDRITHYFSLKESFSYQSFIFYNNLLNISKKCVIFTRAVKGTLSKPNFDLNRILGLVYTYLSMHHIFVVKNGSKDTISHMWTSFVNIICSQSNFKDLLYQKTIWRLAERVPIIISELLPLCQLSDNGCHIYCAKQSKNLFLRFRWWNESCTFLRKSHIFPEFGPVLRPISFFWFPIVVIYNLAV